MEFVQEHINSKWSVSKFKGAGINTLESYSAMGEMGFAEEFVWADFSDFYNEFQQDVEILETFFEENPDKNPRNLELVDLIQEFLFQRMLKLRSLNPAINIHFA